jgi:uncharacterized Tic20 family protein
MINKKFILMLSIPFSIILVFGGIIGGIIVWKYRANALALHEIQQGNFIKWDKIGSKIINHKISPRH